MQLDPTRIVMQLDPTRWVMSLAGFAFDWMLTREWKRILFCTAPVFLMGGVALAVSTGRGLDRARLAQWYIELGDQEITDWEQNWAPVAGEAAQSVELTSSPASTASDSQTSNVDEPVDADKTAGAAANGGTEEENVSQVSRFAEVLFRRVQMLVPSDRSQFVIAATLAQQGALEQSKEMLRRVAPDSRQGYVPAHALLAQLLLIEMQQTNNADPAIRDLLKHHIAQCKDWDRVPQSLLRAGSDLNMLDGNQTEALILLARSAEHNPEDNFVLAMRAKETNNERVFQQSWPKAAEHLNEQLRQTPTDSDLRLRLAQTYAVAGKLDEAEKVLREATDASTNAEIKRGHSRLYMIRYEQSKKVVNGRISVNLEFLDVAMRIDPTNPLIAEEVAKLVRLQGPRPSEELIEHLQASLVTGSATAVTHAALAELRLARQEFELALPHLEQVVNRMPNAPDSLNNLAYVLADRYPTRREEALGYATRAIAASAAEPNPDFYDTLGFVLLKLDRDKEAVTAIETAIQLAPRRVDFHERVAVVYQKLNDPTMSSLHLKRVEVLRQEELQRIEAERLQAERLAAEKLAAQQLEAERLAKEQLEAAGRLANQADAAAAAEIAQWVSDMADAVTYPVLAQPIDGPATTSVRFEILGNP